MRKLTFADLRKGIDSPNATFSDDEGTKVSIEQTIEVETAASDEAEEAVATEEAIVDSEAEADASVEGSELFVRTDHLLLNTVKYGVTQSTAHAMNHGGELYDLLPALPALESLPMIASPADAPSVLAADGFSKASMTMGNWIKARGRSTGATVTHMVDKVVTAVESKATLADNLAKGIVQTHMDTDKASVTSFKGMYASDVAEMAATTANAINELMSFDYTQGTPFTSTYLDQLRVSTGAHGRIETRAVRKALRGSDLMVVASGWDKDVASRTEPMDIVFGAVKMLPEIADKLNVAISRMEAEADAVAPEVPEEAEAPVSPSDVTVEEAVEMRAKLRARLAVLVSAQDALNAVCRVSLGLSNQFLKGQRAVYACRQTI